MPHDLAEGVVQRKPHDGFVADQGRPGTVAACAGFSGLRHPGVQGFADGATVGAEQRDAGTVHHVDGMQMPVAGQGLFQLWLDGAVVRQVQPQR